jgi:hypothetical protein
VRPFGPEPPEQGFADKFGRAMGMTTVKKRRSNPLNMPMGQRPKSRMEFRRYVRLSRRTTQKATATARMQIE